MTYPDTNLKTDTLDPLYGGRPALEFGGKALQWIANVLDFLQRAHLASNRAPYRTVAPIGASALTPGDVAVVDLRSPGAGSEPLVRKALSGDATEPNVRVLGVCVVGAASGARALIATAGIVPRSATGFASNTAGEMLGVNYATGKLRIAITGDVVVAYSDVCGNALLVGGVG